MSTVNIDGLMDRLVAIEKLAIPAADAVPYALHTQESFPYFTNQLNEFTITSDSHDFDEYVITVNVLLLVGNKTEGYSGDLEAVLWGYVPTVLNTFNTYETLRSPTYDTHMQYLVQARCELARGFVVTENTGIGVEQVGAVFTVTCIFQLPIDQVYP